MANDNNSSQFTPKEQKAERSLLVTMGLVVVAAAVIAVIGFL